MYPKMRHRCYSHPMDHGAATAFHHKQSDYCTRKNVTASWSAICSALEKQAWIALWWNMHASASVSEALWAQSRLCLIRECLISMPIWCSRNILKRLENKCLYSSLVEKRQAGIQRKHLKKNNNTHTHLSCFISIHDCQERYCSTVSIILTVSARMDKGRKSDRCGPGDGSDNKETASLFLSSFLSFFLSLAPSTRPRFSSHTQFMWRNEPCVCSSALPRNEISGDCLTTFIAEMTH